MSQHYSSTFDQNIIPPSTILIIDPDETIRNTYKDVLSKEGHTVFSAESWQEGESYVSQPELDLVLLAYDLPDASAEEVVMHIKKAATRVRMVIMCDKNDKVERRFILQHLPVQGCHEKEDGIDKLFVWVDVVLKNLSKIDMIRTQLGTIKSQIKIIEKNKEGLRYIISSMPETINRLQPLDKFIRGVLISLNGFIDADNSFLATYDENDQLILLVGTGIFDVDEKGFLGSQALEEHSSYIHNVRESQQPNFGEHRAYVPLVAKEKVIGMLFCEKQSQDFKELEIEMLRLFASQAAITIENSNLFKLATVDGLTSLYVRRYFLQRFQEVLQFASRYGGQAVSLLMTDIDHFKKINDTYGHPEGDRVLIRVSEIIRSSIRTTDVAGRLGGEEFAVLLIDTPQKQAKKIAEEIRVKIEKEEFILNGTKHPVTISIGLGNFRSYKIDQTLLRQKSLGDITMHDVRRLLSTTDKALYTSKESGRNRITVAEPLEPGEE